MVSPRAVLCDELMYATWIKNSSAQIKVSDLAICRNSQFVQEIAF